MKKIITLALIAAPIFSYANVYMGGTAGFSFQLSEAKSSTVPPTIGSGVSDSLDNSTSAGSYSVNIGYKFNNNWRIEAEGIKYGQTYDSYFNYDNPSNRQEATFKHKSDVLLGNIYYDFNIPDSEIHPYITAGLGYSFNEMNQTVNKNNSTKTEKLNNDKLAWKIGTGTNISMNKHIMADLGIRYVDKGNLKVNNENFNHEIHLNSVDVFAGIKFIF